MLLFLELNNFIVSTTFLKYASWLKNLFVFLFGVGAFISYILNIGQLTVLYGVDMLVIFVASSLLAALLAIIIAFFQKNYKAIPLILFMTFVPSSFLTQFGLQFLLLFALCIGISWLEKRHRESVVRTVAHFSKEYSPLYKERYANRNMRVYSQAFNQLGFMDISNYSLVKEDSTMNRDYRSGLGKKYITRTFKIKGVLGKTVIVDHLYTQPQKGWGGIITSI